MVHGALLDGRANMSGQPLDATSDETRVES